MKYVVFSDIHANLEALKAMQKAVKSIEGAVLICLGDVTGYGGSPNEVIDAVKAAGIVTIAGNHDYYIGNSEIPLRFNHAAHVSLKWSVETVTEENKNWLKSLPNVHYEDCNGMRLMFMHGSPTGRFEYIITMIDARRAALEMLSERATICFVGHTHVPSAWVYRRLQNKAGSLGYYSDPGRAAPALLREIDECEREYSDMRITIREHDVAIVNAGSVGQPRDRDPRGCFVLFDSDDMSIEFHRFEYDIAKAKRKIIIAGMPEILADRLDTGS